jgi:Prokaryotic membrane lipoprotein lipid attachment site
MQRSLIAAVALVALSGCGRVTPVIVTDPAEVKRLARITIPSSAAGLQCRTECGTDRLTYGRFDIPAADLQVVLDQMPKDRKVEPYTGYSNVTSHQMGVAWWQPDQLREPRVAEWTEPGFSANLMFGAAGSPGTLTVYFFNFEL